MLGPGEGPMIMFDTGSGDRFVTVSSFHHFVRHECGQPGITRIELIRRMTAVGWEFQYQEATNPEPPHDVVGLDLFRIPAGWDGLGPGEGAS